MSKGCRGIHSWKCIHDGIAQKGTRQQPCDQRSEKEDTVGIQSDDQRKPALSMNNGLHFDTFPASGNVLVRLYGDTVAQKWQRGPQQNRSRDKANSINAMMATKPVIIIT